ncbi:MAG TPA: carboxypeptidase-like regulatory domain-containing protein [Longimicrobiaceae bacterium]
METRRLGRRRRAALGAVLPALLALGLGGAAPEPGRIVGRVTDRAGNPLAGAAVTATPAGAPDAARSTRSGETGGFEFAGLPPGSYRVAAARPGYAPAEQAVALESGERRGLTFRLREARR